jgi:predicted esterase
MMSSHAVWAATQVTTKQVATKQVTTKDVLRASRLARNEARAYGGFWAWHARKGDKQPDRHMVRATTGAGKNKTTVIMLHGANQEPSYPLFRRLIAGLAKERINLRILAPNRVQTPQVFAQQREPVVLLGHSAGGGLAFDLAQRFPDRVRAVVGVSPVPPRRTLPLPMPALIVHGTQDFVIPIQASREAAKHFRNITLKQVTVDHSMRVRPLARLDEVLPEDIADELKRRAEVTPETAAATRKIVHEIAQFIRAKAPANSNRNGTQN